MEPLTTLFPWMEYVTRAGWTPDGSRYCIVSFIRNIVFRHFEDKIASEIYIFEKKEDVY